MKYFMLLFYCLICLKASGQTNPKVEIQMAFDARKRQFDSLMTHLERDSFKRGITPLVLQVLFEKQQKQYAHKRDSLLKICEGKPVPNFEARDTAGVLHRPSHYYGRVLILHFWNFWDYSFKNEIPHLNTLVEKYRKDGVEVLSFVDLTLSQSEKQILERTPVLFPIIENAYAFGSGFLPIMMYRPFLIFVDKYGRMRYITVEETLNVVHSNINEKVLTEPKLLPIDALEEKIVQLLKE
jgi:thiol-disulfide isomerase/thioredoxin